MVGSRKQDLPDVIKEAIQSSRRYGNIGMEVTLSLEQLLLLREQDEEIKRLRRKVDDYESSRANQQAGQALRFMYPTETEVDEY
jgi:hypothetical protein